MFAAVFADFHNGRGGCDARVGRKIKNLHVTTGEPMNDNYLLCYICADCGEEFYFETASIPGGDEHCEFCEVCYGVLLLEGIASNIENATNGEAR